MNLKPETTRLAEIRTLIGGNFEALERELKIAYATRDALNANIRKRVAEYVPDSFTLNGWADEVRRIQTNIDSYHARLSVIRYVLEELNK